MGRLNHDKKLKFKHHLLFRIAIAAGSERLELANHMEPETIKSSRLNGDQ